MAGIEMFFSGQLDLGHLHVQLGIGVLALAVGLYAIVGANLGGFLLGTILACVGGVLVVAWMTPEARAAARSRTGARQEAQTEGIE